jgi:hypothetical protein
LIRLNDACEKLETLSDDVTNKLGDKGRRLCRPLLAAVKDIYGACDIIEDLTLKESRRSSSVIAPPMVHPREMQPGGPLSLQEVDFHAEDGRIDSKKLYALAQRIGPWECSKATCMRCPYGDTRKEREEQRKDCLTFYLAQAVKHLAMDELATGIPYTRTQLHGFPRKDLLMLVDWLGINRFYLKDRSTGGLISAILRGQKEYQDMQQG